MPIAHAVRVRNGAPTSVVSHQEGYDGSKEAAPEEAKSRMDEKQQKQVNEAAEKFAGAIKESYQALADRSVSAQELNAQLTQEFFNGVINNLRTQAESNRALAEDLIEQQRKQQEASQALTQESVNAYMDFLNSVFALPRGSLDEAQRSTRQ